jgi:FtsH-binding integral membrane protein
VAHAARVPVTNTHAGRVHHDAYRRSQEEIMSTQTKVNDKPARATSSRGERIAKIGTIASAIMASSCCWGPLLLVGLGFLGVSTAGFSRMLKAGLDTYRPVFMVVTFAFLAMAFYFAYRPRRATAAGGAADC